MTEFDDSPRRDDRDHKPSGLISTDPFDITLDSLLGLPDGAHTQASTIRSISHHKRVTDYTVQTVKWEAGTTVFVTEVNAQDRRRIVLPPKVVAVLLRQQDQVTTILRRRQGKRLAETAKENGRVAGFTPEMRKKAAATRARKAAERRARREKRTPTTTWVSGKGGGR